MDIKIRKELEFSGNIIKKILESYKKEKCTAREIEVIIYIYLNPSQTNINIHLGTGLLETVTSKYIKNLRLNGLVSEKKLIEPTDELKKILKNAIKIDDEKEHYQYQINFSRLAIFIKKFREIYDEQKCTAREIMLMIYLYINNGKTISEICQATNIAQSVISKYIIKLENLKFLARENSNIITTTKLNSLLEVVMSGVLK